MTHPWIEYSLICAYLLLVVGVVFKNFNKNSGDYFRGGSQGTWWLVGMGSFMAGISAFIFTANRGAAFEAGWTVLFIYLGNCGGRRLCPAPGTQPRLGTMGHFQPGRLPHRGWAWHDVGRAAEKRRRPPKISAPPSPIRTGTTANHPT
jgi:hypothetical protein